MGDKGAPKLQLLMGREGGSPWTKEPSEQYSRPVQKAELRTLCSVMELPEERLRTAREQDPDHSWRGLISIERRGPPVPKHNRTVMWANGPRG